MGVHLIGVHPTGMQFMGVNLTCVHLIGVYVTGMFFMGLYLISVHLYERISHGRILCNYYVPHRDVCTS
jgi:hypothetical protein